jgi:hypothetical protein
VGLVCSNDAKSCYDLIGHTQAAMAMRRMGVTKEAINCIFTTLQEAAYRVRTGYGDSTSSYGRQLSGTPVHGICQGNGAGPAIWAVLSSPLLDIQRNKRFGFYFFTPISESTFMNNSDSVQSLEQGAPYQDLIQCMQQAVDSWEGGLMVTSGAIVPSKTYWYLVDFSWSGGKWRYKKISECSGDITVGNLDGNRETLRRVKTDMAEETLSEVGGSRPWDIRAEVCAAYWQRCCKAWGLGPAPHHIYLKV